MFKTLGCLVLAMTGTSTLLGWIDPSPPLTAETPSYGAVLRAARSLVTADVAASQVEWRKVEILAGGAAPGSTTFLAATTDRPRSHFRVDLLGRITRTSRWARQQVFDDAPGTVRIEVAHRREGQAMGRAQWHGVQALVTAVDEAFESPGRGLGVHLQEEWAAVYDLEPGKFLGTASPEAVQNQAHTVRR